jgi:PleD family two-component response regulator/EAL domain-containing protein (putative c-di-GMP-specific phosphodiesterase class I)
MSNAAPSNRVFYLGSDQSLATELSSLVQPKGLQLSGFESASALLLRVASAVPAVVILDTKELAAIGGLSGLLSQLKRISGTEPRVICIAPEEEGEDAMERRLTALRAGAASYLIAPVPPRRLASRVLRMCGIVETTRYRILVLDHDQSQARKIATMLAAIGMETLVVEDPMKVLARMQSFRPNLVLMDLYLAGVTGPELTMLIRDHDDFYGIPILFLSEEEDLDKQLAALKAGGDGFISKPVAREALIAAVEYRMRMSRWLQDRRTLVNRREAARGFLPRDVFLRHLDQIIRAGGSQGGGSALMLVDIGSMQAMLATQGLTGTEKALREVESRLSEALAPEESATRMDDFRYAVLAKRESAAAIDSLGGSICQLLGELGPQDRDARSDVGVSVGVALFDPSPADAMAMVVRAEKSLAAAGTGQPREVSAGPRLNEAPEAASVVKRLVSTALSQNGFLLLYQPILSLNQREDELYEAQIRMKTLDGEQIPPADFLTVAERAEMMPSIDRWVLRRAFEVTSAERSAHPRLRLLVHQSLLTLAAPEWFPWLRDEVLRRSQAPFSPLVQFQMAEVRLHRAEAKTTIERLRSLGIQVCVANVSGLREEVSLLGRLGVSLAKLAFHTVRSSDRAQLAQTVQSLQARAVAVIAPGIDDQATVSRVWASRPDFIQGNYLQTPQPELSFDFHRVGGDN